MAASAPQRFATDKVVTSTLDYTVDLTPWVSEVVGDSIASVTLTSTPAGLTLGTPLIVGNQVVWYVYPGGLPGGIYRFDLAINCTIGSPPRQDTKSVFLGMAK